MISGSVKVIFLCLLLISIPFHSAAQTAITTINATTAGSIGSTKNVTAPADAVITVKAYDVTYGTGNLRPLSSFEVGASTYSNLINPDTVILQRQFVGDEQLTIFYSRTSFDAAPTPGTIGIETTGVVAADSLYLLSALNAGLTNVLSNVDDVSAGFEVEIERIDYIWFQGIQSSEPTLSAFPIFDLDGNDNVAIAAITSLDANGAPASYGRIVGIGSNIWSGGNISIGDITVFRQETAALDNLPFQNFNGQTIEGIAVTFDDLEIGISEQFYGYSLFAPDVVDGYTSGVLGAGPHDPETGIDLSDISTFPDDTPRSIAGLDLIISASAAASVNDAVIETVGPGGYKDALRTWLKANDGAFVSNGGATASEGNNVGFWEDQSVGKHNYSTSGTAPTFRSTSSNINFNPAVDFIENAERALATDNNEDYNVKGSNTGYERKSINIAFRTNANDITTKQQLYEQGGGTNGLGIYIRSGNLHLSVWNRGNQAQGDWNDDGSGIETVSTTVSTNTEYIVTLEYEGDGSGSYGGTVTGYLNGQSMGVLSNPFSQGVGLLYNHSGGIELGDSDGSRYDDGGSSANSFEGEIAEFIYCNEPSSLPLSQRRRIESYLAIKYGITLDQSTALNYVNSDGNIIFNTTNPAAIGGYLEYNNDIAGIGRDDASELIQLRSKSENVNSIVTIERATSIGNNSTWLIWGNDEAATTESDLLTKPDTIDLRISRVWRVAETNEIGNTSVTFDLDELGLTGKSASDMSLLIAGNSSNADFSSATVISGGVISGTDITFSGVNFEDGQYFTLGTAFFFCTPGRYNDGILYWLRADEGVTTATEGASVTVWADQTPQGNNGTNITAPVYRATTNLINDNPTVDFSTGSTGIAVPTVTGINDGESLSKKFTVAFRTGDDITTKQVIYEQGGATRGLNVYIASSTLHVSGWNQASDGTGAPWNTAAAITTVNTSSIASNSTYVLTFDYDGNDGITGTITGYLNGQSFGTPLSNIGRLYSHTDAVGLGDENSASRYDDGTTTGASSFDGFISEISYYNAPSSYLTADRNRIESSMAIKYGVTLDQTSATNYTRSDATTVWDATTNATYNNDIAGIGRDDGACLDQKQSQSENSGSIVKMGLGSIASNNASNSNSFDDDGDFLIWGNDGDFANQANANTSDLPGSVTERMERIWKAEDTGLVGATEISFDLTGLGYGTNVTNFQLIVSDSETMNSGTTTPAIAYDAVTNTVSFTGVNLTNGQFFTLATDRDQCGPGGVTSDLYVWLRADLGTSTTTDNTTISTWSDQAISGPDATADGNPPLFKNNATDNINFNPTIDFDGTNDRLSLGNLTNIKSAAPNAGDYTLLGVGLRESGTGVQYILGSQGGDNNQDLHFGFRSSTQATIAHWGNDTDAVINAFDSPQAPYLVFAEYDGSGRIIEEIRNGDIGRATDGNTTDLSGTKINYVGDLESVGNYNGLISEVIVFEDDITDLEKQQVITYVALKYGITLTNNNDNDATTNEIITGSIREGDYVSSDGTTIVWNHNDNSTYSNDIAGIGRDDASCWIQRQSRAEDTEDILTIGLGTIAVDNASNMNSFAADRNYLIWGNDNGATLQASAETSDIPASLAERIDRVWKVQETGTVGETELQFDLTGLGYSVADAASFSLLIGNTNVIADASIITGGTLDGNILSFTGVNLTDGQFFSVGTVFETCGPGGVNTDIALWLAADKETFSDAGTTATVNLDGLQQWNDQSAPPSNASEFDLGGVGPVLPVYRTEEFNFNPAIRFADPNSTNASFMRNTTNTVTGDFTLISVFKSGQSDGTSNDFVNSPALIGADDDASNSDYGLGIENGRVLINANDNTGTDAETTTLYNDDNVHFALATRDQSSGAVAIFVDSESAASGTGSTTALTGPTNFGIGNHSDPNVNAQFSGDIAETIVFDKALDENERTRVESYLAIKYGITRVVAGLSEAAEDYLAGDGGIIWDIDDQGLTYHNDIFGIGRDDLSCLEQTKSKSENSDALVTIDNNGSFASDDAWLISGNDNAPIEAEGNKEKPAGINSRLNREWRVQETGSVGTVRLSYNLSTVTGPSGIGTNNLNQTRLMVDDDGNFSNGGTTLISPVAIDGTNDIVTFEVDFTSGQYYSLGSIEVAALPITLISFQAKVYNQDQVKIDWTTAAEEGNAFFTLERSANGIDFETVTSVDGAGNSNELRTYSYVDTKPMTGLSFYRLKQTDFNGTFDYSEIRSVKVDVQRQASYKLYPNPIQQGEILNIAYSVENDQTLTISVLNTKGQVVLNHHVMVRENEDTIQLATNKLRTGLNLIRIIDENNQIRTIKLIVH